MMGVKAHMSAAMFEILSCKCISVFVYLNSGVHSPFFHSYTVVAFNSDMVSKLQDVIFHFPNCERPEICFEQDSCLNVFGDEPTFFKQEYSLLFQVYVLNKIIFLSVHWQSPGM